VPGGDASVVRVLMITMVITVDPTSILLKRPLLNRSPLVSYDALMRPAALLRVRVAIDAVV